MQNSRWYNGLLAFIIAAGFASPAHGMGTTRTKLLVAVSEGDTEKVQLLLNDKNTNIDFRYEHGRTVLMQAIIKGDTQVVKVLLDGSASANLKDVFGNTALIFAAELGHTQIAQLLLAHNALVNLQNSAGDTALMNAAEIGHAQIVQLLLDSQAEINAQDKNGWNALIRAVKNGHTQVIQLLLDNKADVNAQTKLDWTSLMYAAHAGHIDTARLLLDNGADPFIKNDDGKTAYEEYPLVKKIVDEKAFSAFMPHFTVRSNNTAHIKKTHESPLLPTEMLMIIRDYVTGPTLYNPTRDLSRPENNPNWRGGDTNNNNQ